MSSKAPWITYRPELKVLDCTIRDGGLVNSHRFSDDMVRAVYETCLAAGIDYMEIGYKNDALHDPFLTEEIAALMGLSTLAESAQIKYLALITGEKLKGIYAAQGVKLLDFKLEFGRFTPQSEKWQDGQGTRIILADEITPDTCRLVDMQTGEKLDKDLFRFDLGDVGEGYQKLLAKLGG